jgi:hypothetical protein
MMIRGEPYVKYRNVTAIVILVKRSHSSTVSMGDTIEGHLISGILVNELEAQGAEKINTEGNFKG